MEQRVSVRFVERARPARRSWAWLVGILLTLPLLVMGASIAGPIGGMVALTAAIFGTSVLAEMVAVARSKPDDVVVEEDALVVGSERIPRKKIVGGFDVQGVGVVIDLADGTSVKLGTSDAEGASVLEHFGLDASRRTLRMPLRGTIGAFTMGFLSFFASALVLGILSPFFARYVGAALLPTGVVLPLVVALIVAYRFGSSHMLVGQDGIRIHGVGRVRFIPRADIVGAHEEHGEGNRAGTGGLVLQRRRGPSLTLPTVGVPSERVRGMARRIEQMGREPAERPRLEGVLARGTRSVADWKASLEALCRREVGFRDVPVGAEDLARVLSDGQAAPEQRVGAALALRRADPDAAAKIRIAAETTVADELRAAFEAIAEDEAAADAAIERATRVRS